MASLATWLEAAVELDAIYEAELGRSVFSDPQAFVNWAYWRIDQRTPIAEITDAIRQSDEWRQRHGAGPGTSPPPVLPPPSPPTTLPGGAGGVLEHLGDRREPLQITDRSDGDLVPRMYSYWANAVVLPHGIYLFAGHASGRPRFFRVHHGGHVERMGPLVSYIGEAEGWYWDAEGWLYVPEGPRLHRVNPFTGEDRLVLDISDRHPGCRLWQVHSSDDGRSHSATVEQVVADGKYPRVGTVCYRNGEYHFFETRGTLDESQISRDGRFLLIKEGAGQGDDNLIVDFDRGTESWILDADGALGHSDMGHGFAVGEDNQVGACMIVPLDHFAARRPLFGTWNMGHVSVRAGRCLLSDGEGLSLVALDGRGVQRLALHGMTVPPGTPDWEKYNFQVHANLDPTGQVACYMSNHGTDRQDVYLLRV